MDQGNPKGLNGAEIREAVAEHLKQAALAVMQRNLTLSDVQNYGAFEMRFSGGVMEFKFLPFNGETSVLIEDKMSEGEKLDSADPDVVTERVLVADQMDAAPPNVVRVNAGLSVPSIVKGPGGKMEQKAIKYAKPEKK